MEGVFIMEIWSVLTMISAAIAAALAFSLFFIMPNFLLFPLGFCQIITCFLTYYVYQDAIKRQSKYAFLWAVFTFFWCVVAIPAYFIFRPKMPVVGNVSSAS